MTSGWPDFCFRTDFALLCHPPIQTSGDLAKELLELLLEFGGARGLLLLLLRELARKCMYVDSAHARLETVFRAAASRRAPVLGI